MRYNQLTQEKFIEDCKAIHGDEYDYSLIKYVKVTEKIKIICKKHGIFEQLADHHKRGSKCPHCRGLKKKTNETFISEAKNIHGARYDYSLVQYKDNKNKIKIICNEHGIFEQYTKHHLNGSGCPECKNSRGENSVKKLLNDFNIEYKRQKTFDGCKDLKELQFDFYLIKYNICIEYDGIQHFKVIERFGGIKGFERRIFLDNIKNNFCINNNIKLIRIKYDENILDKLSFLKHL